MLTTNQIISIFSAVGVSTIIGTIFTFAQFNKKNNLEYITQERAKWREDLRKILVDIEDASERADAIIRLKGQLNPYGKNIDFKGTKTYFMQEGHIWDLLEKDVSEIDYGKLSFYIELLLKYDWERSKDEIKYQVSNPFYNLFRWLLIILSIYLVYKDTSLDFPKFEKILGSVSSLLFKNSLKPFVSLFYEVNILCSLVTLAMLLIQNLILERSTANYMSDDNKFIQTFITVFVIPYLYVVFKIIFYLKLFHIIPLLSLIIFTVILIFVLEYYVLKRIFTFESDYISHVEKTYYSISTASSKEIQLHSEMVKLERKLHRSKDSDGEYLKKKIKKINRRRLKKIRSHCFRHPIKYLKWRCRLRRYKKFINKEQN